MASFKQELNSIIQAVLAISDASVAEISCHLKLENIAKSQEFIKLGKRDNKEYFLLEGICKSYLMNPDGEEISLSFFTSGSIISPHQTRSHEKKSLLNFRALSHLRLASIDAQTFEDLMVSNLEIREFANRVLQMELQAKVEKEIGLASLTAKERLLIFREKFRALENHIPHRDIASFLGITNISLSRLRKELSN